MAQEMLQEALVTGANRGIGLEYARQLKERGYRVTGTARDPDSADELRALDIEILPLDVTDPDSVDALAEATSGRPLDLLVNNAGIGVRGEPLGRLEYDKMVRYFDTNTLGPLRLAEAMLPRLRAGSRKVIANMTSRMGSIEDNGSGGSYAYRASKAALNMVNRSLAVDLRDDGIIAVVLHPGWVRTRMGGSSARIDPEESVGGLLDVIEGLGPEDSGEFFDYTGERLPW